MAYCLCWQASLLHLRPCLDSASVRSRESLVAIRLAPVVLAAKFVVALVPCGREPPNLFKCEVRSPSFLFPRDSWLQFAGHSHVQVESVQGKGLFETLYKQALGNIHESVSWFLSQQHWSVPRHVILWQKMLVTLPVTFPSTALTISQNTQASEVYWGSLEADMSENYPTCSSVKWEVLPLFCLKVSWMQFAGHSQVRVCKCIWGRFVFKPFNPLQASTVEDSLITRAHDSFRNSISLSQDIWHRGRRYL